MKSKVNDEFTNAAWKGDLSKVSEFLIKGADIHTHDDEALRYACEKGYFELVKFLVDNGANVHAYYDKSIILASQYGYFEIVKFLTENGADIHATLDGPLRGASKNGHIEVVEFLIENGADISAYNNFSVKAASKEGHIEVVKLLIEQGANTSCIENKMKVRLGIPVDWERKPDDMPRFVENESCPISDVKLTADVFKLGCSECFNTFEQTALKDWFKIGQTMCPMCRIQSDFYRA